MLMARLFCTFITACSNHGASQLLLMRMKILTHLHPRYCAYNIFAQPIFKEKVRMNVCSTFYLLNCRKQLKQLQALLKRKPKKTVHPQNPSRRWTQNQLVQKRQQLLQIPQEMARKKILQKSREMMLQGTGRQEVPRRRQLERRNCLSVPMARSATGKSAHNCHRVTCIILGFTLPHSVQAPVFPLVDSKLFFLFKSCQSIF